MKEGKFYIADELYRSDWDVVSGLFKHFKPYNVGYCPSLRSWEFVGTSEFFEELGCKYVPIKSLPQYEVLISTSGTNKKDMIYNFTFKKVIAK